MSNLSVGFVKKSRIKDGGAFVVLSLSLSWLLCGSVIAEDDDAAAAVSVSLSVSSSSSSVSVLRTDRDHYGEVG